MAAGSRYRGGASIHVERGQNDLSVQGVRIFREGQGPLPSSLHEGEAPRRVELARQSGFKLQRAISDAHPSSVTALFQARE